jgi:hypothetical protein
MRPIPLVVALVTTAILSPTAASAMDVAMVRLAILVQVSSRTSLTVSTDQLRFDSAPGSDAAVVEVDFSAGARIPSGTDIVLTVQPLTTLGGVITFNGNGDGTRAGTLTMDAPSTVGRWRGSGVRRGRLVFTLRDGTAGASSVPVRFVLSAP